MPAMPATDEAGRLAALRARLASPMPDDRPWGWLGPLLVTAFGTFLRFNRLRVPRALIFDETYYVKDAWSILNHGVELNLVQNANDIIQAGHTNIFASCNGTSACGEYVVQPEVGKLLIAAGEWLFGLNSFGWRFASAVFGSLAILLMCRIARRMTRSTLLGCVAGLLMSLDGLEFVLSRTGILDIFLMFFVLAAFGCVLIDRDISRAALAERVARREGGPAGPRLGIRRWRVAAGIFLGLAVATKWDAAWYIIGFAALGTAWDIGARRAAGLASFVRGGLAGDALAAGHVRGDPAGRLPRQLERLVRHQHRLRPGLRPAARRAHPGDLGPVLAVRVPPAGDPVRRGPDARATRTSPSRGTGCWSPGRSRSSTSATPARWPARRTTARRATPGAEWSQEVLAIGTPAIWWGSMAALLFCLGWWLLHRDWRAGAVLCGVAAGWLPWFPLVSRTKFYYYALEFEPFLILSIVLCLGLILGPATASALRRSTGALIVGAYVLCVLLMFWYFYAILAGQVIPYHDWYSHMWYRIGRGWI